MRIRPGAPPTTRQTAESAKTSSTSSTSSAQKSSFQGLIEKTGSSTDQESRGKNALMEEMERLAAEVAAGETSTEDVSRKFVGMVIEQRFGKQNGKGAETMTDRIGEMVESDPQFVSKLQSQLKRITKK
jgi:cytoskeletal protein RodZ